MGVLHIIKDSNLFTYEDMLSMDGGFRFFFPLKKPAFWYGWSKGGLLGERDGFRTGFDMCSP